MARGAICLWLALLAAAVMAAPESVQLQYRKVLNFPVKFVTVNMRDPEVMVSVAVAPTFPRGLESFGSFVRRLEPAAAINGTYFCPRSYMPVGDVAVNGELLFRGVAGTALCITPDNRVAFMPGPRQWRPDWTGYQSVLSAGPRLLANGKVAINAKAEGFRDPHVLGSARRSAVAWRPDGLLLLLTVEENISLQNLAYVCLHLGATEALTLDGGSSSGLYAEGRTVTRPSRSISNIICVYSTRERSSLYARQLLPPGFRALAQLLTPGAALLPYRPQFEPLTATEPEPLPAMPNFGPPAVANPLLKVTLPETKTSLHGTIPVSVAPVADGKVVWTALHINGQLRAMSNVWPMEYPWDSTKELDGVHTLEISAWAAGRKLLGTQTLHIRINNTQELASSVGE